MLKCLDENNNKQFEKICEAAYRLLSLKGEAYAELVFAKPNEIQELNKNTRGKDSVTDVLSFGFLADPKLAFTKDNYRLDFCNENGVFLGSVVICQEKAIAQAREFGHDIKRETEYLLVHGLLHLLGYDHECDNDKKIMRKLEESILQNAKQ